MNFFVLLSFFRNFAIKDGEDTPSRHKKEIISFVLLSFFRNFAAIKISKIMRNKYFGMCVAIVALCGVLMGCKERPSGMFPVVGTLEGDLVADSMPEQVRQTIADATKFHQYAILEDSATDVSVWVLQEVDNGVSTEGYGITVVRGAQSTTFPEIYHGKNPRAHYIPALGHLWLFCGLMEGTGTMVECARRICFREDGTAYIDATADPYMIQEIFCERLMYSVEGERITFYDYDQRLCTVTNTVTDMGGLDDEQPIWIGEQIRFDYQDDRLQVCVTPGVKFVTGLVLTYDDMPTFMAPVIAGTVGVGGSVGPLSVIE